MCMTHVRRCGQIPSCWPPGPLLYWCWGHASLRLLPAKSWAQRGYRSRLTSVIPRTLLMDDGSRTSQWAGMSFLGIAAAQTLCPHLLYPALHRCPVMQSESSPTFSGSLLHRSVLGRHFLQEISYVNMFLMSSEGQKNTARPRLDTSFISMGVVWDCTSLIKRCGQCGAVNKGAKILFLFRRGKQSLLLGHWLGNALTSHSTVQKPLSTTPPIRLVRLLERGRGQS